MAKICKYGFDDSTIVNKRGLYGIGFTQNLLSGRWKYFILWFLKEKSKRFSEIKKFLSGISQGSLTKQLKELESDGLIHRKVYPEVPPRVEYSLTEMGQEILPILKMMETYGKKNGEQAEDYL
ncbi:transcriptional regulator [Macrococcoides canis]|uniref:Transcriptional regulator n=1 Tax=Macrococcoides canis TaxID=1855823 RepID=A0AAE6WZ06_9STAP|nr:helix-turn-helix domain-containing protein [Macrococcus canis]QIH77431.1 transcriptional regulator [Macrococcus canis]